MEKVLFIVNPLSGGKDKKKLMARVNRLLDSRFARETVYTEHPGHATSLAERTDAGVVVAVGGDGTVSEVARGLLGTDKALGIIPCGSGDGLALHLGISRKVRKAVAVLNAGHTVPMDCATVDGEPFFCTTGVGLDAITAWKFARSPRRGIGTYIAKAWEAWHDFVPDTYTLDVDGHRLETPAVIVTVGNANQWGNQARITSLASVTDGELDVAVVLPFKTLEIPLLAAKLLCGRAHTSRRVKMLRGRHITLSRTQEGPAHADGDPCLKGTRMRIDILPAALRVVAPKDRKI